MDRRIIVALLFATLSLQVYMFWFRPADAEKGAAEPSTPEVPVAPEGPPAALAAPDVPVAEAPLKYCNVSGKITSEGGFLRDAVLTDRKDDLHATPVWRWAWNRLSGNTTEPYRAYRDDAGPAQVMTSESQLLGMGVGKLDSASPRVAIKEQTEKSVVFEGATAEGVVVTRSLHVRDDCLLDVEVTWKNAGTGTYNGKLWLTVADRLVHRPEVKTMGAPASSSVSHVRHPVGMVDGAVHRWADLTDEAPVLEAGPVQWFGISDYYFASFLIPAQGAQGQVQFSPRGAVDSGVFGSFYVVESTLQPGESVTQRFRMYTGLMDMDKLSSVDPSLASAVDLGIFGFFGKILLWLLKFFHSAVGNWGLAIVCLTVLVKVLTFPLTQRSFQSGQAMQALQPRMTEIREKYADNPEEMNRQIMALYTEGGVNPLGGCLPMLVQMPIWIALYSALQVSVDLYQSEFLYLKDLSSMDPYGISPLVVAVLMWAQQQMTPMGNMDPAQQRIMKLIPLMFGIFFFTSPSGLVVYMFVNMLLTMVQQWWNKRNMKIPAVLAG